MPEDGSQPADTPTRPRRKAGVLAAIGAVEHPELAPDEPDELPALRPLPDLPAAEAAPGAEPQADDRSEAVAQFEPVVADDEPQPAPAEPALDAEVYLAAMERAAMERAVLSRLPAAPPRPKGSADATHRRVRIVAAALGLAIVIGVAVVLIWVRPACCGDRVLPPSTVETGAAGIGTGPGVGNRSPQPGVTARAGASAAAPPGDAPAPAPSQGAVQTPVAAAPTTQAAPPPAAPLRASYRTTASGLLGLAGYRGEITLTNPNRTAVTDWTVVVELVGNNQVEAADGAVYLQLDKTVTFIPADTGNVVPAHGSTTFTFEVRGLLTDDPTACTVNGRACEG
jgi:hypothetical protein